MGADSLASTMLMFIAVMGMTLGVIVLLTNYVTQTSSTVSAKQKSMISQLQTDVAIISVDPLSTQSEIYVKNIGASDLRTNCLTVIVDNEPLTTSSYVVTDPETGEEPTLWTQTQTILINATHSELDTGKTHEAKIVTCNGVTASYIFSLS